MAHDTKPRSTVVLHGAGATFPAPLYQMWFQKYQQKTGVQIDYWPIGSGGGIKAITARSMQNYSDISKGNVYVDFGASDRGLDPTQTAAAPGIITVPITIGTIAVIYNIPGVGAGLRLTPEIVADIYLGKITHWNDPRIRAVNSRLRLPNLKIVPCHRSDGTVTTEVFTKWLSANSSEWRKDVGSGIRVHWPIGYGATSGGAGIGGLVKQTSGSIGYDMYAYAIQNVTPYATIQNRFGAYVLPSLETGASAASTITSARFPRDIVGFEPKGGYPLSYFTYLLFYPDAKPELKEFIRWALTNGAKDEASLDYSPLPPRVTEEALAAVDRN